MMCFQSASVATRGMAATVAETWQCHAAHGEAERPRHSEIFRRYRLHAAE